MNIEPMQQNAHRIIDKELHKFLKHLGQRDFDNNSTVDVLCVMSHTLETVVPERATDHFMSKVEPIADDRLALLKPLIILDTLNRTEAMYVFLPVSIEVGYEACIAVFLQDAKELSIYPFGLHLQFEQAQIQDSRFPIIWRDASDFQYDEVADAFLDVVSTRVQCFLRKKLYNILLS